MLNYSEELFREVVDALRALYDEQNGAPLETRRHHWEQAMEQAHQVLLKYECDEARRNNDIRRGQNNVQSS